MIPGISDSSSARGSEISVKVPLTKVLPLARIADGATGLPPGGTARLRVSGAITRRFGKVIGPSLKGSNSLVWLMSDRSGWMMIGDSWALRAILAIPEAIRLAQRSCARSRPDGRHRETALRI